MWSKILVFVALVCQLASSKQIVSVDFVENVRGSGVQSRIVSGWQAAPGQFPYQVAVRSMNQLGQILGCGGSVIHNNWVLTAAHCTAVYPLTTILAGLTNINNAEYVAESREWYIYPTYIAARPEVVQADDISIVRLQAPMVYTANLQRVQIQPYVNAFDEYAEEKLIASGWGRTWTGGSTATELQWVYLRGVDQSTCSRNFGSIVNSNTICARWYNVTSQSICQGDSGGPLVATDPNGKRILVGVTSFVAGAASGGCHSGHPGGFIRPGPFHQWYTQISGIDFENIQDETTTTTTTTPEPTTVPSTTTTVTVPPTTQPTTTTTSLPPTTEEDGEGEAEGEEEEEDSDESDESDEDKEVNKLLKKLKISVKVKVDMKKYKSKNGAIKEVIEKVE